MPRKFVVDEDVLRNLHLLSFSDGCPGIGRGYEWSAIREEKADFTQAELATLLRWIDKYVPSGEAWELRHKILRLTKEETPCLNKQPV